MSAPPGADPDRVWSEGVARQYEIDELEAMCTWLDVNIDLNQQRLESVTNRICTVLALAAADLALLASAVTSEAWPLTSLAVLTCILSMILATFGLRAVVKPDRDPTTTWDTMWGRRLKGELQAILYRRRSVLYGEQRKIINKRASALKTSSWTLVVAVSLSAAAILVSRLVGKTHA